MEKNFGVKGFDSNLKCRGFQFSIGKIYEEEFQPKICSRGFHYCKTISDVFKYYPNKNGNRFCLVEIIGDIEDGTDKCCTNKIKIVRELSSTEISNGLTQEQLASKLKEFSDKGFIIGGSIALRAHGYSIERSSMSDIDIITTSLDRASVIKEFSNMSHMKEFSSRDSICSFKGLFGEKYDILSNPQAHFVKRNFIGVEITVQDEIEIWEIKLKYALNGMTKHMNDILSNNVSFRMNPRETADNQLPF